MKFVGKGANRIDFCFKLQVNLIITVSSGPVISETLLDPKIYIYKTKKVPEDKINGPENSPEIWSLIEVILVKFK